MRTRIIALIMLGLGLSLATTGAAARHGSGDFPFAQANARVDVSAWSARVSMTRDGRIVAAIPEAEAPMWIDQAVEEGNGEWKFRSRGWVVSDREGWYRFRMPPGKWRFTTPYWAVLREFTAQEQEVELGPVITSVEWVPSDKKGETPIWPGPIRPWQID